MGHLPPGIMAPFDVLLAEGAKPRFFVVGRLCDGEGRPVTENRQATLVAPYLLSAEGDTLEQAAAILEAKHGRDSVHGEEPLFMAMEVTAADHAKLLAGIPWKKEPTN